MIRSLEHSILSQDGVSVQLARATSVSHLEELSSLVNVRTFFEQECPIDVSSE